MTAALRSFSLLLALWFVGATVAYGQSERAPDGLLQRPALQALVEHQIDRNGDALIQALSASDPDVRARAAFALGSVQDTAAIEPLGSLLRDSVPGVRTDAAFALGQMPSGVPSSLLMDALRRERDAGVRDALIRALGRAGSPESLSALVDLNLPATDATARAWAIAQYGRRGFIDSTAVAWLVDRLEQNQPAVRNAVAYVFGRLSNTDAWRAHADALRRALDGYASTDPAAMHLIRALGRRAEAVDQERFLDWLANAGDWRTRVNAARALASFADDKAVQRALMDRLDDVSSHVALTTAQTLAAGTWTQRTTERIAAWMEAHPEQWRIQAPLLRGMATHGQTDRVLTTVRRWRKAAEPVPFAAMLAALAPLDTAQARTELLAHASHDDPRVAAAALQALANRWTGRDSTVAAPTVARYFETFTAAVQRGDVATIRAAASSLLDSRFANQAPTDTLVAAYRTLATPDDLEAMTALVDVLSDAPDAAAARPVLERALDHSHSAIRKAAASALDTTRTHAEPPPPTPPIDWDALARLGPHPQVQLETPRGRIVLSLAVSQAPQTVQTIVQCAQNGQYDGVPFHRVIANFVIQGGDFVRRDGYGGPGFFLRSEFTRISYRTGTLGMASAGKDTEGSQFFITHSMQPHLDGRYTAFGRVVEGQAVVDRIQANDRITTATVVPDANAEKR